MFISNLEHSSPEPIEFVILIMYLLENQNKVIKWFKTPTWNACICDSKI